MVPFESRNSHEFNAVYGVKNGPVVQEIRRKQCSISQKVVITQYLYGFCTYRQAERCV